MQLHKLSLFQTSHGAVPGIQDTHVADAPNAIEPATKTMRVHIQSAPRIDQDSYLSDLASQLNAMRD